LWYPVYNRAGGENMGRLSEFFDQHRDNVEEALAEVLKKADSTIESLSTRVKELEQKLRDVAGEKTVDKSHNRDANLTTQNAQGVATADQSSMTDGPVHEGARKQNRTKK